MNIYHERKQSLLNSIKKVSERLAEETDASTILELISKLEGYKVRLEKCLAKIDSNNDKTVTNVNNVDLDTIDSTDSEVDSIEKYLPKKLHDSVKELKVMKGVSVDKNQYIITLNKGYIVDDSNRDYFKTVKVKYTDNTISCSNLNKLIYFANNHIVKSQVK